ncbi:ATP-binding protein [Kribbella swartbergensis]
MRARHAGHRVVFATAAEWVARLADAHHTNPLQDELVKLGRTPLLIVDEVGYIPRSMPKPRTCTSNSSHPAKPRPPRRSHHPERRQLPTQGPRRRPRSRGHQTND